MTRLERTDPSQTQQILFAATLSELRMDRKGREAAEVISSPRIVAMEDQLATISQGTRTPAFHGFKVELRYLTESVLEE